MLDHWQTKTLETLATVERGRFSARPRNDPQYYGGATPFIQTGDVSSANGVLRTWSQTLNAKGVAVSKVFPAGTIFVTIAANIGDTAISTFDAACPDSVVAVRPRSDVDRDWLYQALSFKKDILDSFATQNAQKNINLEILRPLPFDTPLLAEQRRIAEILFSWDAAIEKVSRLVNLRGEKYLGIRDRLINWSSGENTELSEFLKPVTRPIAKPSTAYRALSLRSHGKGSYSRIVQSPESVDMDTLYIAKSGDVIVNITFAWEGAIALVPPEHDGCLVSHRFPTFIPVIDRANARYLRHALRTPRFTHLLKLVSPGGAGRNRVLNKKDFLLLQAPLPSVVDQEKIGATLDNAEKAIEIEIKRRDLLIRQKRGLMQKLLTGEWRVPIREGDVDAMAARVAEEAAQ